MTFSLLRRTCLCCDFAAIVDAARGRDVPVGAGAAAERIELGYRAVLPDKGAGIVEQKVNEGHANDVVLVANVGCFAGGACAKLKP